MDMEVLDKIQPFSGEFTKEASTPIDLLAGGHALTRTQTQYVTAVKVQEPRSLTKVFNNVLEEARLAGKSFYYGWEVKNNKTGKVSRVEGGSIDLGMCLARNYGNSVVDVEVFETPTHYLFRGVFIDLENGFTCPRLFRQRKTQSIGEKYEADRAEDIVFQIGQSKAIRNAVLRAMPEWMVNEAIEAAKASELNKLKKTENLYAARQKVVDYFFREYGVTQDKIEAYVGRRADQWDAQDVVDLRGVATALKEGRVGVNELFPAATTPQSNDEPQPTPQPAPPPEVPPTATTDAQAGDSGPVWPPETHPKDPAKEYDEQYGHFVDSAAEIPLVYRCTRKAWERLTELCKQIGIDRADYIRPHTVPVVDENGEVARYAYQKHLPQERGARLIEDLEKQLSKGGGNGRKADRDLLIELIRVGGNVGVDCAVACIGKYGRTLFDLTVDEAQEWMKELMKELKQ